MDKPAKSITAAKRSYDNFTADTGVDPATIDQPTKAPPLNMVSDATRSLPRPSQDDGSEYHQKAFAMSIQATKEALELLTDAELRTIVLDSAQQVPYVANLLLAKYDAKVLQEQQKVIDFDHHSKYVWRLYNREYARLSSSKQSEMAGNVLHAFLDSIATIRGSVHPQSSFGTKRSALETLRRMAKTLVMGACDELQSRVVKDFQGDPAFEDAMSHVIQAMVPSEREQMCKVNGGEILEKLDELSELGEGHCVLEEIPESGLC